MRSRKHSFWIPGAVLLAAALLADVGKQIHAQAPAAPYTFLMTRSDVERIAAAWNDELPFIPGEVLVKFSRGRQSEAKAVPFRSCVVLSTSRKPNGSAR